MTHKMQNMDSGLSSTIEKTTVKPGDAERAAIREMVRSATDRGLDVTGPDGLFRLLTKTVLETGLDEEITDHLGYESTQRRAARRQLPERDPNQDGDLPAVGIRRLLSTTNAIESLNAQYRRAVDSKGHCPSEQAALKTGYLATRSLDPKGTGQKRWITRWKPVLNVLAVVSADRVPTPANL